MTETFTPSPTPTLTFTLTPTPTWTPVFSYTWTSTPTSTNTLTVTPTPTQTDTSTPTLTSTWTPTVTATPTQTLTSTPTPSSTPTFTLTFSFTPTDTASSTPTSSPTQTPTFSSTPTATLTFTPTNSMTDTLTPTPTATPTPTSTPSFTLTETTSFTPTVTATATYSSTSTGTFTATATLTPTSTPTWSSTMTSTFTPTTTFTATLSFTSTATPTATATPPGVMTLGKTASEVVAQVLDMVTFDLSVTLTGSPVSGAVVSDSLPAGESFHAWGASPPGTTYQSAGSLLTWNLPPLSPGVYDLTYTASVNSTLISGQSLLNRAWLTYPVGAPVTAQAELTVVGSYTLRAGVYNEAGELIQTLTFTQSGQNTLQTNLAINDFSVGPSTIVSYPGQTEIIAGGVTLASWNGNGQDGNPVPNGNYYISLQSITPTGQVTTVTRQVAVNRVINKVTIQIFNEAGEVVRNLYTYTSGPVANNNLQVSLSTTAFEPTSGEGSGNLPTQVTITLNNGTTEIWNGQADDGAIVPTGRYFVVVHSQDGLGGELVVTRLVTVMSENAEQGLGNLTALPNIVNASSPGGYNVTFTTHSSQTMTLTYRIYDIAGELVSSRITGPAGMNIAVWDASLVASGCYLAVVEALNLQGGWVGRKTLKVVVVH